jgi:hypothetical protein
MPKESTFRPTSSWVYFGFILAIEILVIATFLYIGKVENAITSTFNSIAINVLFWIFVVHPKIVFTDAGIKIYNPFQISKIGWLIVEDFETRYSFAVITGNRKIRAWAATAPGRYSAKRTHPSDFKGTGFSDRIVISPSDSPRTDSGMAFVLATKRRDEATKNGTANSELIRRIQWHNIVLTGFAVTILWINVTQL